MINPPNRYLTANPDLVSGSEHLERNYARLTSAIIEVFTKDIHIFAAADRFL